MDDREPPSPEQGTGLGDHGQQAKPIYDATVKASENSPVRGSVVQSSNGNGGATTDKVDVTVMFGDVGGTFQSATVAITPGLGSGNSWTFSSSNTYSMEIQPDDAEEQNPDSDFESHTFHHEQGGGSGTLYALYIVASEKVDTNWLAAGQWAYIPDDATELSNIEIGAFVDGSSPFTADEIAKLGGTASYQADDGASGIYTQTLTHEGQQENEVGSFSGDVALTANFDDENIQGRIYNIEVYLPEWKQTLGDEILLGMAPITDTEGGFFTGDARMRVYDDITGKWGGQFYNFGGDHSGNPEVVAGTFSVAGELAFDGSEGEVALIGVFVAGETDE